MKISLIIPVKDEGRSIAELLDSVFSQSRRPDEVVIADAGSSDDTIGIVNRYIAKGEPIRVAEVKGAYPGKARNAAIEAAASDVIAMTDGGISLDREWLKELEGAMEGNPAAAVIYGNYEPRTDTFFKECLALAFVAPPRMINGVLARTNFIASSLVRKDTWRKVGGFPDFRAAEDRIFMERLKKGGFKEAYAPKARVTWDIPSGWKETFDRFSLYSFHDLKAGRAGDWHLPVLRMYLAAFASVLIGAFVAPVFFLLPVVGFIMRVIHKIGANRDAHIFKSRYAHLYLALTGFLVFLIDMAMFTGWIRYILRKD
jgi:glycosyltransferase involved in cell wall biosynthesis